ncbi:hypothetical protein D8B26_002087 [Coccidioides posadasii str. Silveira]|uniref:Prolyl peptidase n=1 Tax=Coccidioides posadasii (strain RMSCC 757 / Silveira) TaxID=443226 RepID=E9CUT7_COCPS|nr:prolyl peptidase [Coccidioides posadasii str. Silveira]QVM07387.1 hypothetical protein D8B26_002087 [Coccidioides posadasii str. Silveira]
MAVATLISKRLKDVPGKLKVAELFFEVPVDYRRPKDATIRLFARSVQRRSSSAEIEPEERKLPWVVYLQGGPGMGCSQPQDIGWVGPFLDKGYQVLLLDQRGTGLSSPITAATLALQGNAVKQAEYLRSFRADSIVQDCEAVRMCLTADYPLERQKWSVLGQSFGGFCAVTYLSKFPQGLREVFTTGGLPPLVTNPEPVLEKTYGKLQERNKAYYGKFPEDKERVQTILRHLEQNDVKVPDGGALTPERFLSLGISLGMRGGLDYVHDIVLRCSNDLEVFGFLTRPTISLVDSGSTFDNSIIYAVLHEAIYCQGAASNWCADRVIQKLSSFRSRGNPEGIFFTGEMVYKNLFETSTELKQIKEAADIVASYDDWPELYDKEQLANNEVPVYSATYVDDMYVHYDFARETAASIKGCKNFITNTMYHNALRANMEELLKQLFAMRDDTID